MAVAFHELRYAIRLIRRNKGFSLAVLLSTALGVGATASIFSLIDALLLRPLPVPATGRVVRLTSLTQSNPVGRFSYADIDDLRKRTQSFEGLATSKTAAFGFSRGRDEQPRMTIGIFVNGDFFTTLRVTPTLGRAFTATDDQVPGRDAVVILSHGIWQREFGGRADVVGRSVRLNGAEFTIVGVAPAWFTGVHPYFQPALYVPRMMIHEATGVATSALTDRAARSVDVFARLNAGVSIEQARDELKRLATVMEQEHPATDKGRSAMVFSQVGYRIAEAPDNFMLSWLFFAVAALVLSIACINVANLLLSTAPGRLRETAVRLALGASRGRLLRQFLIESAVLSTLGAVLGLGIAAACASFIRSLEIATELPVMLDTRVDARVVVFALAVGVLSGVLAGALPSFRRTRADLHTVLKSTELRFAPSRGWMRQTLVVAQVAVALVMMVLSGLFLESIRVARDSDPGFRVDHILTMGFDPRITQKDLEATHAFYRRLLERVVALPGVRAAAIGQHIPLGVASSSTDITIPGYDAGPTPQPLSIGSSIVGDRYFDVLGIPIVRGRAFTDRDTQTAPAVAIVNEVMAKKYWPRRDALGATITIPSTPPTTVEIVGIARTSKTRDVGETPQPFLYLPLEQSRQTAMTLFVQTEGDPAALSGPVRNQVRALDSNQPIYDVRTMASHFQQQALFGVRLVGEVITAVGLVGLALSVLGLYAVIAYSVSQRTREIGIRMAVGASERRVLGMVMRQGLTLSAIGIGAGLVITFALSTVLGDLLNGVNPRDPRVYSLGTLMLLAVTMLATYLPARRASQVDPQVALRSE
ncbi:MAG TPA: ABC transporter permease [Vicinamibacterales bacterium]|nr:ABC transporter permease [Vicinamibacterales bacterium]